MPRHVLPESSVSLLRAVGVGAAGHALFFRHGAPLLALPPDREVALSTAGLYLPQSLRAKAAAGALRALCRAGLHVAALPRLPGEPDGTGALFCNPDHGSRAVVVKRGTGGALRVVKAARPEDGAPVEKEHAALSRFRGVPGVPETGPLCRTDGAVSFDMPYLPPAPRGADPAPLLAAWDSGRQEPAAGNGLVKSLLPLLDSGARAEIGAATVRRALVHGDFAPWNWRAAPDGRGIVCIDWEWAREDGFAGFDLAYCLVQTAILVRRAPEARLLRETRRAAAALPGAARGILEGCGLGLETLVALATAYRKTKGRT